MEYKKAQAKVKRIVREAKWKYWRDFCCNIGTEIQVSEIWGIIRKMGGIRREFSLPVLKNNDIIAITNEEKSEMLAKAFVKVHSSQNLSNEEVAWRKKVIEENKDALGTKEMKDSPLDMKLILFELKRALLGVRNTSPGKDGIVYKMIEQLSDVAKNVILKLYNKVWDQGKIPKLEAFSNSPDRKTWKG